MIIILLHLVCNPTIIINKTPDPWDRRDERTLERARYVCSKDDRYKHDTPCVKKIIKYPERNYSVICGERKE